MSLQTGLNLVDLLHGAVSLSRAGKHSAGVLVIAFQQVEVRLEGVSSEERPLPHAHLSQHLVPDCKAVHESRHSLIRSSGTVPVDLKHHLRL